MNGDNVIAEWGVVNYLSSASAVMPRSVRPLVAAQAGVVFHGVVMTVRLLLVFWIFLCGISVARGALSEKSDEVSGESTAAALSLRDAILLGVIEGATEYLPVSSTGHLLIVQHWLGLGGEGEDSDAASALAICIQLGAILAVVLLYFSRIQDMLRGIIGRDPNGRRLVVNLLVAFAPAAVIGLLFRSWIKAHLFGVRSVTGALVVGALLILATARRISGENPSAGKDLHEMSWRDALLVGGMQCLAFWPGFSRSLATILGCHYVGMRLSAAVEFSFLLGLVTLSAATGYEGLKSGSTIIDHYGIVFPLVSLVVAFVAAAISIRFMVSFLGRNGLTPFAWYRIALAAVTLLMLSS